jgi:hypothetical protein
LSVNAAWKFLLRLSATVSTKASKSPTDIILILLREGLRDRLRERLRERLRDLLFFAPRPTGFFFLPELGFLFFFSKGFSASDPWLAAEEVVRLRGGTMRLLLPWLVLASLKRNFQAALTDNEGAPQEDLGRSKPKNKKRNSRSRPRKN